ncbi:hypothetical protein L2703_01715 [Shewanella basaltis]|uniref:hypothetical protein n=1 Tax=Shewanella basaltis TaxID=472183 RepID=UPI00200FF193|nr:hypothetical protein [Shewanella basaltis]MCL1112334.1 hypothetical protein [Shewanella basaltis]
MSVSECHDETITVNVTDTFFVVGRSAATLVAAGHRYKTTNTWIPAQKHCREDDIGASRLKALLG